MISTPEGIVDLLSTDTKLDVYSNVKPEHMIKHFAQGLNKWGIPTLEDNRDLLHIVKNLENLQSFRDATLLRDDSLSLIHRLGVGLHFYLNDKEFEVVWNKPLRYLNILRKYLFVLSPDFSLYTDWPLASQIWNTYRNRWMACFFQDEGIPVVPTISWSDEESYEFCFEGILQNQIISISTVGMRDRESQKLFLQGYKEMIERLQPSFIIVYGRLANHLYENRVQYIDIEPLYGNDKTPDW